MSKFPSDLEIAQSVNPRPITEVGVALGILPAEIQRHGPTKAKVLISTLDRVRDRGLGRYVVVAGISPTPLGEGKSTTTIGLSQAFGAHLEVPCVACIRQPSQGPTFGVKGGAAGGGYSQVIPMEEFNLHGTGDIHAIAAAHNLLAAALDTRIFHEATQTDEFLYSKLTAGLKDFAPPMLWRLKKLGISETNPADLSMEQRRRFARLDVDPATVSWRRVVDVNDRMLRSVIIGCGPNEQGLQRETGFDITVASEVMAILALSANAADMRQRLGSIVVAQSKAGEPITAEDVGCAGAMMVLLKDTIHPTLMQTLEATPVFVHAGPFGNIAHGNSSIIADQIALRLVGPRGVVVTEAGFGADMGCEKFFNIKCRTSGLSPDAAVIVATVRALKYHGGVSVDNATAENVSAVVEGVANLKRHAQNIARFGVPAVVALNRFTSDTEAEIEAVVNEMKAVGVPVVLCTHWAEGGKGAANLGHAVLAAIKGPPAFRLLYPDTMSLREKMTCICVSIYGGEGIDVSPEIEKKIAALEASGYGKFPICMAKTQYSFSHDATLRGAPTGFRVPIRDVRVSVGARFVFPLLGTISTMPGLPIRPAYFGIDLDTTTGAVRGLF